MLAQLSGFEIFYGSFTIASVIISTILGLLIALKYRKYKQIDLILVGITWILLASPYWSDAIQFITVMLFSTEISVPLYFFLANAFIAPMHITWIYIFTKFIYKRHQKKLTMLFGIEAVIFELVFIAIFFVNPLLIGNQISTFVVEWALWIQIYLLMSIVLFLITGFLFARASLKTEDLEIKLKGKFLIVAFLTFTIGTIIDVIGAGGSTEILIFLARTFVIISSICFYIGFTLPKFIKDIFLK